MESGGSAVTKKTHEYPVCKTYGSDKVLCDAWAEWNPATQMWELHSTFDDTFCEACECSCKIDWRKINETETERTRRLNDEMRSVILTGGADAYGSVVITHGVADFGPDFIRRAGRAIAEFDAFDADNDPHQEHDFGAFEIDGEKLFWKLDYFSLDMAGHSPDKSDVAVTHRVLTMMLASEY